MIKQRLLLQNKGLQAPPTDKTPNTDPPFKDEHASPPLLLKLQIGYFYQLDSRQIAAV